jgi:hypothetical protein
LVPPDVTTPRDRGELLAEISRSLVLLHTGERTLRDAGRGEAVEDQRGALQDVLRHRFTETIEELTGRKVLTFISGVDLETETSAEVFVLEEIEGAGGDEREAMQAWAEQTRHQARLLREEGREPSDAT